MNKKISDFSELTTPADGDLFEIVDVSDTSEAATGTNKKIQYSKISIADATTTVKGKVELATDAETITGTDTVRAITPSNLTAALSPSQSLALSIMSSLNPVGTIREFNVSTNPATLLGFGTWTAYGAGKFTIAIDSGDATMDTVDETGGAKTVTIGQTNLPNISTGAGTAHTHVQNAHSHTVTWSTSGADTYVTGAGADASGPLNTGSTTATNQNESAHTHSLGGSGTALNVMNPFIVVYRWVRTV